MVGGGVCGTAAGIGRTIMTGAGRTMGMFQGFIMTWIRVGGYITGTAIGADTRGTMSGSLSDDCDKTGAPGALMAIGNGREHGTLMVTDLYRPDTGRTFGIGDRNNIVKVLSINDTLSRGNPTGRGPGGRSSLGGRCNTDGRMKDLMVGMESIGGSKGRGSRTPGGPKEANHHLH
jgi:hypothetical protein